MASLEVRKTVPICAVCPREVSDPKRRRNIQNHRSGASSKDTLRRFFCFKTTSLHICMRCARWLDRYVRKAKELADLHDEICKVLVVKDSKYGEDWKGKSILPQAFYCGFRKSTDQRHVEKAEILAKRLMPIQPNPPKHKTGGQPVIVHIPPAQLTLNLCQHNNLGGTGLVPGTSQVSHSPLNMNLPGTCTSSKVSESCDIQLPTEFNGFRGTFSPTHSACSLSENIESKSDEVLKNIKQEPLSPDKKANLLLHSEINQASPLVSMCGNDSILKVETDMEQITTAGHMSDTINTAPEDFNIVPKVEREVDRSPHQTATENTASICSSGVTNVNTSALPMFTPSLATYCQSISTGSTEMENTNGEPISNLMGPGFVTNRELTSPTFAMFGSSSAPSHVLILPPVSPRLPGSVATLTPPADLPVDLPPPASLAIENPLHEISTWPKERHYPRICSATPTCKYEICINYSSTKKERVAVVDDELQQICQAVVSSQQINVPSAVYDTEPLASFAQDKVLAELTKEAEALTQDQSLLLDYEETSSAVFTLELYAEVVRKLAPLFHSILCIMAGGKGSIDTVLAFVVSTLMRLKDRRMCAAQLMVGLVLREAKCDRLVIDMLSRLGLTVDSGELLIKKQNPLSKDSQQKSGRGGGSIEEENVQGVHDDEMKDGDGVDGEIRGMDDEIGGMDYEIEGMDDQDGAVSEPGGGMNHEVEGLDDEK